MSEGASAAASSLDPYRLPWPLPPWPLPYDSTDRGEDCCSEGVR